MSYNSTGLADLALKCLDAEPGLTLAELAERLGVCRQTLERAIRARTGKTYRQWRCESIALKAGRLLAADAARCIKQVAYDLGYESPQAFSRFIRMAWGCSPSQLRRSVASARAA